MPKLRVLSLFCGCGGADLGAMGSFTYLGKLYKGNQAEIVHASDINEKAVATYNLNFKHKAQTEDVRRLKFRRGFADVVIGGFPCQSFSTAGKQRGTDDDRRETHRMAHNRRGARQRVAHLGVHIVFQLRISEG